MLSQIDIKEDVIKLIAASVVESGITLLGGIAGVGKTLTATATIDYIKDNNMFPADLIFSVNTFAEKAAGSDIKVALKDLSAKHAPKRLLVVLDEICYENSAEIAIWLAEQGHSVFGVTQAYPRNPATVVAESMDAAVRLIKKGSPAQLVQQNHSVIEYLPSLPSTRSYSSGLSSVIVNAVLWVDEDNKTNIVGGILNNLNLLILQDSLFPTHYRALMVTDDIKQELLETLDTQSLYKLYLSIDALKVEDK